MSIDQLVAEAMRLPLKQRALLAESLWESLGDSFEGSVTRDDSTAAAQAIQRDEEIESGKVKPLSHEELMARLRR